MEEGLAMMIRDTREHSGHGWKWNKTKEVAGTIEKALKFGDYSIVGLEDNLVIERKGSPSELIGNMFSADKDRFLRELENLKSFKFAWIICEFTLKDVSDHLSMLSAVNFKNKWKKWKSRAMYITMDKFLGYVASLTVKYGVNFIFAGKTHGKDLAKKLLLKVYKNG